MKRYNKEVEHLPSYVWMANEATRDLPVYGTTIVAMRINGIRYNEILEYDPVDDCWSWVSDWYEGQTDIEFIGAIPLDEVRPVVHGKWIDYQQGRWIYAKCSECETVHDVKSNFCPNCGAKMEGNDETLST